MTLSGAAYTEICPTTRACVPQSGTTAKLDAIGDRLMHRAAYRNFGTYESLVTNMTVSSGGVASIRWYEFRNLSGTPTIYQQGTYQPDSTWRWMGSAAQDKQGNIAVGYSASSSSIYPQIRYAGRLVSDTLGQLTQGETTMYSGTGSQTATHSRWGDYSSMMVDPADECTFWYTQEYYTTSWRTRIGSFKFPGCTSGPTPTATNTPVGPTATNTPIPPTATNTPVPSNNDDFGGAITTRPLPYPGSATTPSYTTAADDPALCAGSPSTGGHSAWYKYTPATNQTLNLDTLTSNYDTILAIFTGSRGALTRLACNDDSSGTTSAISNFAATAGTTYYIEIASYGTGAGGSLVLHVSALAAPTATYTPVPPTATNTPLPPTATTTPGSCPNVSGGYCRTDNETRTWVAGTTNQSITGDDQVKTVTLPFTFRFMGTNYTSIKVSSNGNAHFGTASTAYSNVTIPRTTAPNALIAAFWDDMNPAAGGAIYTGVSGTSPNRIFVIEWRGVPHYGTTNGATFEIQLFETTNHIWVIYQDTIVGSTSYNSGLSATAGIENSGGTAGNLYSYNTAVLTDGKVLHYWPQ